MNTIFTAADLKDILGGESLENIIFDISPKETPFGRIYKPARRLTRAHGGMRARRRRMAKALFKPKSRPPMFEWTTAD